MKAGDIVFVRGNSIISNIIRFFDKGNFSHVAIAVSDSQVIEINWNMKSKIVDFYYEDYEIVSLNLNEGQRYAVPVIARKLEGVMYDYLQIISYIFKGRLNNPRHFICSELVYNVLKGVGYLSDDKLKDMTPNELYASLKRLGGVTVK